MTLYDQIEMTELKAYNCCAKKHYQRK